MAEPGIELYFPKLKKKKRVADSDVLHAMYFDLAIVPPKAKDAAQTRQHISSLGHHMPLFDIKSKNIYLIERANVYNRVVFDHYRFLSDDIVDLLRRSYGALAPVDVFAKRFKEKLQKNIQFIANFDLDRLRRTFFDAFMDTNPSTQELTTCVRRSYLPQQTFQQPYYTKQELVHLARNMGLIGDADEYQDSLCDRVTANDISATVLLHHQLYIQGNNAKQLVQFYSAFGSAYINGYMRDERPALDPVIEHQIADLLALIGKSPGFDKEYIVYRLVESDEYLQHLDVGDVYAEPSFISTSRNPFYNPDTNAFGLILLKIHLPKNILGVGVCLESYSHFPREQEILLPPGRLKLLNASKQFEYHHPDPKARAQIVKKYEFSYLQPSGKPKNELDGQPNDVPVHVDFSTLALHGETTRDKILVFLHTTTRLNRKHVFTTSIGGRDFDVECNMLPENPTYRKFFFLQKEKDVSAKYGSEVFMIVRDRATSAMQMIVEVRHVVSINYYNRHCDYAADIDDADMLHFVADLCKAFQVPEAVIHGRYASYMDLVKKELGDLYSKPVPNLGDYDTDIKLLRLYAADTTMFSIDAMEYLQHRRKRFNQGQHVSPNIPYSRFNALRDQKAVDAIDAADHDDMAAILTTWKPDASVAEYYVYIHQHHPYHVQSLQQKLTMRLNIPADLWHVHYTFKPFEYLHALGEIDYVPVLPRANIEEFVREMHRDTATPLFTNRHRT